MKIKTDINIKSIIPCPIKEAVIEIRFDGEIDKIDELFFGIYHSVKEIFGNEPYIRLPVLDIPLNVRKSNKNFEYAPHYQLNSKNYIMRVAPCAISIALSGEYTNWKNFSIFIESIINKYKPSDIQRIGLRYISFFNMNIFEKTNIDITIANDTVTTSKNLIRHEFEDGNFTCILQINNINNGSNIDIDVVYNNISKDINIINIAIEAHTKMKHILSTILKEDFIKELENA